MAAGDLIIFPLGTVIMLSLSQPPALIVIDHGSASVDIVTAITCDQSLGSFSIGIHGQYLRTSVCGSRWNLLNQWILVELLDD